MNVQYYIMQEFENFIEDAPQLVINPMYKINATWLLGEQITKGSLGKLSSIDEAIEIFVDDYVYNNRHEMHDVFEHLNIPENASANEILTELLKWFTLNKTYFAACFIIRQVKELFKKSSLPNSYLDSDDVEVIENFRDCLDDDTIKSRELDKVQIRKTTKFIEELNKQYD